MAFTHTEKVDTESFFKARIRNRIRSQTSGSDKKGTDPTGYGTLRAGPQMCTVKTHPGAQSPHRRTPKLRLDRDVGA
jgi:hypothetical protein